MGVAPFPFFLLRADLLFHSPRLKREGSSQALSARLGPSPVTLHDWDLHQSLLHDWDLHQSLCTTETFTSHSARLRPSPVTLHDWNLHQSLCTTGTFTSHSARLGPSPVSLNRGLPGHDIFFWTNGARQCRVRRARGHHVRRLTLCSPVCGLSLAQWLRCPRPQRQNPVPFSLSP